MVEMSGIDEKPELKEINKNEEVTECTYVDRWVFGIFDRFYAYLTVFYIIILFLDICIGEWLFGILSFVLAVYFGKKAFTERRRVGIY